MEVPAYAAMQDQPRLSARMLDILMRGVSTRQYRSVIPEMADTVGVSKSSVSRQIIEAAETEVETLLGRRFDELKLVVIYIDGMVFGDHVMIGAVGMDAEGHKHVLAIREGATENATVVKELLEDLVARGVNPDQKRLFVIDGSKALRTAINAVFGSQQKSTRASSIASCKRAAVDLLRLAARTRLASGCRGRHLHSSRSESNAVIWAIIYVPEERHP